MKMRKLIIKSAPLILLLLSLGWYSYQAFDFTTHMHPMMDEGSYLLKGLFYLNGTYSPYQDYGPITNKPPFSFYSLGISQLIEPGLRSGRYFAVALGIGTLIGLWFTAKRLFSIWWSSFLVSLVSLSTALIMYMSKAMTQAVTSFIIIWVLFLILDKNRPNWQILVGGVLAVLLPLTRQNLLPLYFLLLVYIYWEHGNKSIMAVLLSLLIFISTLANYWPGLFTTYVTTYLPEDVGISVLDFFDIEYLKGYESLTISNELTYNTAPKITILFQGIRNYFLAFIAAFMLIILVPFKKVLSLENGKICIFLLSTFIILVGLHYYAILSVNVLINNYPSYLAFFWPIGFLLIPFVFSLSDKKTNTIWPATILFLLVFFTGLGFSLFEVTSDYLLHIQVPRFKDMQFLPGTMEITSILSNKFDLTYKSQRYLIGSLSGFLSGALVLLLVYVNWRYIFRKILKVSYSWSVFVVFFFIGAFLTPFPSFSGDSTIISCNLGDILTAEETVASEINAVVPPTSLVYYENKTPITLLYIPGVRVFPPQLNKYFYFVNGGEDEEVSRFGYWNISLAEKWLNDADYIILGAGTGKNVEKSKIKSHPEKYQYILTTSDLVPCSNKTNLRVYKVLK